MSAMRPLRLDYQRSNKPVPWLGLALLVVALATLAVTGSYYRTLNQQIVYWESKTDRLERLSSHRIHALPALTEQEMRAQVLEVKQANQVVRQLTLPWNALFKAVEISGGNDIALLSMEPDMQKGTVTISGEAKNLKALLNYVKQLSAREVFGNVFLQNHKIQQTDPEKPLHFSLLAYRRGTAP
jgi:hypothetical protein